MRAFIAIELPEETRDKLSALQQELKASGADVKWVRPENIHLTLKFLGEINEKQVELIKGIIDTAAGKRRAFRVRVSSLGAFPRIESPRVVWIDIEEGDEEVKGIAAELQENISWAGIPKEERPFSSHITIGRIRSPINRDKLVRCLKDKTDLGGKNMEFYAGKITLFKSTLTPKGPLYETLKEANLKNS